MTEKDEVSPYEVHQYNIDTLNSLFTKFGGGNVNFVSSKVISRYFSDYFTHLQAKTILVEVYYVDHDYLEDYTGYYARCFKQYPRHCSRIHFFNREFSCEDFSQLLSRESCTTLTPPLLKQSYLGFIVVKPLPQKMVGKTCLKTYDTDNGRRYFIKARSYSVNLFGYPLEIQDSLAFQEQDSVAAACATSALWAAFQGTGELFHHNIPSPFEITKSATRYISPEIRPFPNWVCPT